MTYSDTNQRAQLIAGLRAIANFLESRPEMPAPRTADLMVFPSRDEDAVMCAEIDKIAALLGTSIDAEDIEYGHYGTRLDFGPVTYKAVAVKAERLARHIAASSYADAVTPDMTSKEV